MRMENSSRDNKAVEPDKLNINPGLLHSNYAPSHKKKRKKKKKVYIDRFQVNAAEANFPVKLLRV